MHLRNVVTLVNGYVATALLTLFTAIPAQADAPILLSMLTPPVGSGSALDDSLTVHEVRSAPAVASAVDLTAPTDNLWVRLRNGFAMTNLNDDLTLHYQQWYQNRPDALRRMVERSRPYLHHIVEELEARGMPTELALLPMVESSFNPMAYSRAHASGLWQFIPATGKRFNLEQNWWHDQRRDIVASTNAALDYLQTIYEMHGDWHLALASYNWGEGAVKRAIERNQAKGLPTDYASLHMPGETRNYVPKLQALKNIFNNAGLMNQLGLPSIINRPYFATVETPRPMDVKTAARLANMSVEEFQALNPAHNRPVMKAETPVVVPAEKVSTFRDNLENHDAPLTEWQAYTLKPGEKLEQLAPRFGITLPELLRANGLQGRIKLAAGATVLVPAGQGGEDVTAIGDQLRMPQQIAEPEPRAAAPVASFGKSAKLVKGVKDPVVVRGIASNHSGGSKAGANANKLAKSGSTKSAAITIKAKSAPAASTTKVAKSGNGRRG